ncbi:phosphatidate cytidylyltransferase [Mycoplasmopsis adleri]|uniref:phosphatidate cytidylyltransferase n=1 Tax=Mycoplasmopsis adleri TaxID=51362 RepID=UPI003872E416
MKLFKERILPAFILIIVMPVFIVPIAIFANEHYQARIYGYVYAFVMLSVLLYELFTSFKLKWYYATVLTTISIISIFMPIDNLVALSSPDLNIVPSKYLIFLKRALFSWETLIIISVVSLSFFLIELNTLVNMSWGDRVIRLCLMWFSLYALIVSIKFIQISLYYCWYLAIFLIAAPSVTDIGAFFGGKLFGKKWINKPFAPNVSPKKTWEGFIFGILAGWIFCGGMIFGLNMIEGKIWAQVLLFLLIPFAATAGDLYYSHLKRLNDVKDYSKILAGHGGLLDRFDSISFAVLLTSIIYAFV